jgi:hypothetical protein
MKKVIIGILAIASITTSSMSFAWDRDGGWRHGGGWDHHTRGFGYAPALIAGAALAATGAYAYNNYSRPYYAPPRVYYEQPRPYYVQQPFVVQQQQYYQQPIVIPQQSYPYQQNQYRPYE